MINRTVLKTPLSMRRHFAFNVSENQSLRVRYTFWRRTTPKFSLKFHLSPPYPPLAVEANSYWLLVRYWFPLVEAGVV